PVYDPTPAPAAGNPVGRAALVAAIVLLVLSVLHQLVVTLLPVLLLRMDYSPAAMGAVLAAIGVAFGFLGLVVLILGIVGLARRGGPKGAAGFAVGVGGTVVLGTIVGLLAGPVSSILYQ